MLTASLSSRLHRTLGLAAVVLSLVHEAAIILSRHRIMPYSPIGRLNELLIDGGVVFIAGVVVLLTTRPSFHRWQWLGAALLAAVSMAEFLRYFAPFPAVFSVAALVDGMLVSLSIGNRAMRFLLTFMFSITLAMSATFLFASYFGAGQ